MQADQTTAGATGTPPDVVQGKDQDFTAEPGQLLKAAGASRGPDLTR
jgi:hypothetical protein